MLSRIKYRSIITPLLIYMVCGATMSYFVWAAVNGDRGLKAKRAYKVEITALMSELDSLKAEHASLEARNLQLRSGALDKDLLEEEARSVLGRVHKNDLVVFLSKGSNN